MTKKTKIIVTALAAVVVVFAGVGIYMLTKDAPSIVDPAPIVSSSVDETISQRQKDDEYKVPPIVVTSSKDETASTSTPQENTETVTQNPDGSTTTEISRPEFSKPEPPAPPEVDEKDATDPKKPPEYKPEPPKPDKPTGGDTNNKGKIYVPGFGWMNDPGNGSGTVTIGENAGTGEVIGH